MSERKIINDTLYSIVAFIIKDKKILMFNRSEGEDWERWWEPIKGGINIGETEEQALLREVNEEAGVDIKIVKKLMPIVINFRHPKYKTKKIYTVPFICLYPAGDVNLGEKEHSGYKWMSFDEFIKSKFIEDYIKEKQVHDELNLFLK